MGLDMYLRAKQYVSGYEFAPDGERDAYGRLVDLFGVSATVDPQSPSANVEFTVGYWRKANHIHRWFVDNVQEGKDECQESYVSRKQLVELRSTCERVLEETKLVPGKVYAGTTYDNAHPEGIDQHEEGRIVEDASIAEKLLPTTGGFFFGGTDYDEWYIKDLGATIKIIDRALAMSEDWDFYYQSSW